MGAMQLLMEGVHRFREEEFGKYKAMFRRLSREGQKPHTLFITCADSRVLAELITQSNPGDLFVIKNVGNMVPLPSPNVPNSTGAGIEFAVEALGVSDIVVCGHSQCGAINALINGVEGGLQQVETWVNIAAPVRELIQEKYQHLAGEARMRAAEEENVLFALQQLHHYPCVRRKLDEGVLRIHGWFFKIARAELFAYDPVQKQFSSIQREEKSGNGQG